MKKLLLCIGIFCLQFFSSIIVNACNCGFNAGTTQNPSFVLTPTSSWKTEPGIRGGDYTLFNVVQGNTYTWSYCSADGGSASWDTRVNLYNNSTQQCLANNSDYCGLQSRLTWIANFTGVVRIITNYYTSSNPCGISSALSGATLAYKITGNNNQPDLTISNQSLSSTTITAGSTVQAYARENNIGSGTATANVISIHLSANDDLTPGQNGDTYLDEIPVNNSISAGNNSGTLGPENITIPSSTTPGSYYVFFSADGGQDVTESNEINNFATVQITVQSQCTYSLSASSDNFPSNGGSGSYMVNTQSNCSWTATTGDSWISTSSSNTGTGRVDYTVQSNGNANSRTGTISAGGKTFTILQDGVQQQKPDLTLGNNISVNPNPVLQGNVATIICDFKNLGQGNAQNVITTFWLSNNCTGSIGNDYLLGTSSAVSVSANSTNTQSTQVYVPIDADWLGTKYIKCAIDYSDVVSEINEGNNRVCLQVTIQEVPGQQYELSITPLNNSNIVSHLRWPFETGKWNDNYNSVDRDNWANGYEYEGSGGTGHKKKGHTLGEAYADDWNNTSGQDCDTKFYSPVSGKVIFINKTCDSGNHYCSWPGNIDTACSNGFGHHIVIQCYHNENFVFRIAHLNAVNPDIDNGDWIDVGYYLGDIGATGKAYGSHAHCVLYQNVYNVYQTTGQVALERLKNGNALGIDGDSPYANEFAAAFKFDAVKGGGMGSGGGTFIKSVNADYSLQLYPNPTAGEFYIQFQGESSQSEICIFNILGEQVYSEVISTTSGGLNQKNINIANLASGMYIVMLNTRGNVKKGRLIIQR
jgi:hypothetical protein